MYNLLDYRGNYYMASGSLWNYYRDKIDDGENDATEDKSFWYKTKITPWPAYSPPYPDRSHDHHGH